MAIDFSPLNEFAQGLAGKATPAQWAWQIGAALAALGLGYLLARLVTAHAKPNPRWKFGEGEFRRVLQPAFSYAALLVARVLLERHQPVPVIVLLQTLLLAWIAIRIAAYVLGHVLPDGNFLKGSIRTVAWIAWLGVALKVTGLLPEVLEALDDVGLTLGKGGARITLLMVMQAAAALALTLTVAAWVSRITESRVLAVQQIEMSTRVVINKLVRTVTLFIAVLIALPMVGIDMTALSVFGGALGVGVGVGLQKIASNYLSGFIVLLDRSLRIGDLVTVDNRRGIVTAIETRYTVIKGSDGTESIVPNEKLITDTVSHHTFTDPRVAVILAVNVAYGSDMELALSQMLEAARGQAQVLADPAPVARFKQFRDDGVEAELVCWIADVVLGDADLRSALIRDILRRFAAHDIRIPAPRRDLRILAVPESGKTA